MAIPTAAEWRQSNKKRVLLFGMSGLGKTHISNMLREAGGWFHYSVDYRIGTRYMGEHIVDNFKREAMRNPFLAELLQSDSIYIASNITFNNLRPLSTYLGQPGAAEKGGLSFGEYMRRQNQHREAEIAALLDTPHFIQRAKDLYRYDNFVCDTGGSICEVVDPWNPDDTVLKQLSASLLMVWIEGGDAHTAELIHRFEREPKPMYYEPNFLRAKWQEYLDLTGQDENILDPVQFTRWTFAKALKHREPRYAAMADAWGVRVPATRISEISSAAEFDDVICEALEART